MLKYHSLPTPTPTLRPNLLTTIPRQTRLCHYHAVRCPAATVCKHRAHVDGDGPVLARPAARAPHVPACRVLYVRPCLPTVGALSLDPTHPAPPDADKLIFRTQATCNRAILDVCAWTRLRRHELGLYASPRGYISGIISIQVRLRCLLGWHNVAAFTEPGCAIIVVVHPGANVWSVDAWQQRPRHHCATTGHQHAHSLVRWRTFSLSSSEANHTPYAASTVYSDSDAQCIVVIEKESKHCHRVVWRVASPSQSSQSTPPPSQLSSKCSCKYTPQRPTVSNLGAFMSSQSPPVRSAGFHKKLQCILLTGRGFPDMATRAMLQQLDALWHLPVYGISDCNPYGLHVMVRSELPDTLYAEHAPHTVSQTSSLTSVVRQAW